MQAHRTEAVIKANGTLTLEELPFKEGDLVVVIVLERQPEAKTDNLYPLSGTLLRAR